jgi:general secretion pathway protein L
MSSHIGASGYITLLPNAGHSSVPYWQVQDGEIIADGVIHLGPDAAGSNEVNLPPDSAAMPVMVLVPATIGDLAPRQAETAARISVIQESLGRSEDLHVVSSAGGDGQITIARMSASYLQSGLDILKEQGLDPDILLPVGLAIPPPAA